jgi:hypothetical protein
VFGRGEHGETRISDADREVAGQALADASHAGTLDPVEYERRLSAVYRARTRGELNLAMREFAESAGRFRRFPTWLGPARRKGLVLGAWSVFGVIAFDELPLPALVLGTVIVLGFASWNALNEPP